ncbi:hypothetical protein FACS189476_05710 [Spirochaetia bacterium]|nr:hypothetical protein FACS189476_05710 [Spirochaetia bacterium]
MGTMPIDRLGCPIVDAWTRIAYGEMYAAIPALSLLHFSADLFDNFSY